MSSPCRVELIKLLGNDRVMIQLKSVSSIKSKRAKSESRRFTKKVKIQLIRFKNNLSLSDRYLVVILVNIIILSEV